jgi:hypothetical protein
VPHAILSYTLAITNITMGEFIKGNWAVIISSAPFIYAGVCLAIIKRDLHFRHLIKEEKELEEDENTLDLYDLRKDSESSFWQSWSTIKTPLANPEETTMTVFEYATMAIVGICILVGAKLAVDYMKREIERYEDEFDRE